MTVRKMVLAALLGALTVQPAWAEGDAAAGEKVYKKCQELPLAGSR